MSSFPLCGPAARKIHVKPKMLGRRTCIQAPHTWVPSKSKRRQPGQEVSQTRCQRCCPRSRRLRVPLLVANQAAAAVLAHVHGARVAHLALAQPAERAGGES